MKKLSVLLCIAVLLGVQSFQAWAFKAPTALAQLEDLNAFWKGKNLQYPVLGENIPLTNDVSLIRMHLSLVEETLRNKNVDHLNTEQKKNREKCLDILHSYWKKGGFPKNLYHTKRTPYFIDKFGTACAVGQLIISTGFEEFAERVKNENNNAYISELNSMYPEISEWANTFGFSIDELAWIQPCYCFSSTPGTTNVSCYGGFDGYFVPNPSGGVPPYTYTAWYWWNGTAWDNVWCGGCNLIAGDYKCTVTDAMGTAQDYFATISQPSPVSHSISHTDDNGSCNGSAGVVASGGTPGYTYSWAPGGYITDSITNLCIGTYTLTITDNKGCVSTDTVAVLLATGIAEFSKISMNVFPNPANEQITITADTPLENASVKLINIAGQILSAESGFYGNAVQMDLSEVPAGIYFLEVNNKSKVSRVRFVKE